MDARKKTKKDRKKAICAELSAAVKKVLANSVSSHGQLMGHHINYLS